MRCIRRRRKHGHDENQGLSKKTYAGKMEKINEREGEGKKQKRGERGVNYGGKTKREKE